MPISLTVAAAAFALIFPVEFPDKTFVATLVLATRFRPLLAVSYTHLTLPTNREV